MALTELRNKQNPWFEKRNHVRPAKNQVSKMYIDPSLGGGGGPSLPVTDFSEQWLTDDLALGPLTEWNGVNGDVSVITGTPEVVQGGFGKGVQFTEANTGKIQFGSTLAPAASNTLVMVCELGPTKPSDRRVFFGVNASANNRCLFFGSADTVIQSENGGSRHIVNRDVEYPNGGPVDPVSTHIVGKWSTSRTWNCFGNQSNTSGDRSINGIVYEVLVWDRILTVPELQSVVDYLWEKWVATPPVTDGLVGLYTADEDFVVRTTDNPPKVTRVINQINPGTYDLVENYGVGLEFVDGAFLQNNGAAEAGIQTDVADYAALEAAFQSGILTHIHHVEFASANDDGNAGIGAGSKSINWPQTDVTNNITFQTNEVAARGTSGGSAASGYLGIAQPALGAKSVFGVTIDGPSPGAGAAFYLNGALADSGTRASTYTADVGGTGSNQRSRLSIGRNRSGSISGTKIKASLYYNRALTAQEMADVSAWLKARFG